MRGGQAVKGERFESWRGVGQVAMTVRVHEMRGVDELVLLDISGNLPDLDLLNRLASVCFFPLAVGGGVRSVDDAKRLLDAGADKIVINSESIRRPKLINDLAAKLGSQSVCVSIDWRPGAGVCIENGKVATDWACAGDWACRAEELGAGEILINDITRDGTLAGYNLELIEKVAGRVSIPVIACGGASGYGDFAAALRRGAHAVAAGALWQFTDCTPLAAAQYLAEKGFRVRLDGQKKDQKKTGPHMAAPEC